MPWYVSLETGIFTRPLLPQRIIDIVLEWSPTVIWVELVDTPNIRSGICQSTDGRVEDYSRGEPPSTTNFDIFPCLVSVLQT
jgi:hypothetical protein